MPLLAVLDLETDPFAHGRLIQPFAAGLLTPSDSGCDSYYHVWNNDPKQCVSKLLAQINALTEPHYIYAHNGGRFDFWWLLEYLTGELRIVNGRIIQANLGIHKLRDSFAIMPFPLKRYKKTEIDYAKMERAVRENHRDEILSYLKDDCVYLMELVKAFHAEFGDRLTIGGASLNQFKRFHTFARGTRSFDAQYRERFYFGGRNQVFKPGIHKGHVRIYDTNSMYPYVMQAFMHPIGTAVTLSKYIEQDTILVVVEGWNHGAFPVRTKTGLDFTVTYGTFYPTIHEYEAAIETQTFKTRRIIKTYGCAERTTFAGFVDHFFAERAAAKLRGDETLSLFYKYTLNSCYGKFAQNPDNYCDWQITAINDSMDEPCHVCKGKGKLHDSRDKKHRRVIGPVCKYCDGSGFEWSVAFIHENKYIIWSRPAHEQKSRFNNILTGASITGASRAVLLRGICGATQPLYCDTDSVICTSMSGVRISDSELGAWKCEAEGDEIAIAGKKLYAVFKNGQCIKKASKGVRISGDEIRAVAKGGVVKFANPVPGLHLDGSHDFVTRKVRRTVCASLI